MNELSATLSSISKKLSRGESLKDDELDHALSLVYDNANSENKETADFYSGIYNKLIAGEKLGEYELHMVVDVLILHKRLGTA